MQFIRLSRFTIFQLGSKSSMNFVDKKRILMVNIIAFSCIPVMFYFFIMNYTEGRHSLSAINIINCTACIATLILHYFNKPTYAKIALLAPSFLCFFLGALLFQNAGQYFLISILVIAMLLYDDYRIHIVVSILIITAIVYIEMNTSMYTLKSPIPKPRIIFNILGSLSFILIAITFYIQIIKNRMEKIEVQRQRLQRANQEKERIFSIIVHDIKSPFSTLENLAFALQEQVLNQEMSKDFIDQICDKITLQNKALDELLQWGSSNLKSSKKAASLVNVKLLVNDIIGTFKEKLHLKKIEVVVDIIDNENIHVNKDHIVIIVRNLISNAIKFSFTDGKIHIFTTRDSQNTYIHIKDNGVGMEPAKLSMLFNEIQKRSLGTSNEPGSGLGLVLCRDLIEQNNGTIAIDSDLGKGSTFTIGLPIADDTTLKY